MEKEVVAVSGPTTKSSKKNYYYVLIVAMAGLMMFAGTQTSSGVSILVNGLKESAGFSGTQASSIFMVKNLAAFFVVFTADKYYGKLGIRKGVALAFVIAAAAMVLFRLSGSNYLMICVSAAVLGAAYAFTMILPMSILLRNWFNKNRPLAMSFASACTGLSTLVLSRLIQGLISDAGLESAYFFEMGLFLVVAVIFFLITRDNPSDVGLEIYGGENYVEQKKGGAEKVAVTKTDTRAALVFTVCALLIGVVAAPSQSHFVLTFNSLGYDSMLVASAYSVVGLAGMIAKPVFGVISATKIKFPNLCAIFLFMRVFACALTFAAGLTGGTLISWLPFVCCFIFAFGAPVTSVGYNNWIADVTTKADYTKKVKNAQFCYQGGEIIGSLIPGLFFDAMGTYTPWYLLGAIVIAVVIVVEMAMYRARDRKLAAQAAINETQAAA